jgi:hypothetical protein
MPVLVPTPDELAVMPAAKRDEWLAKMPVQQVVREVVVERIVPEPVLVPQWLPGPPRLVPRNRGVVVDSVTAPGRPYRDSDVVRCPMCGAWTLGICRTGHGAA